jgi:ABC-type cobalt transport system substrate-binding protein
MRNQKTKIKVYNYGIFLLILFLPVICILSFVTAAEAAEWGGVDESVVEKYAEEHGREARDPFINTDRGDLLLFVFLLGGAVGGFIGGYYWRELMERKPQSPIRLDKRGVRGIEKD